MNRIKREIKGLNSYYGNRDNTSNHLWWFWSRKGGIGKTELLQSLQRVVDNLTFGNTFSNLLGKNFNASVLNFGLIFRMDEVGSFDKFTDYYEKIKNTITNNEFIIERKGVDEQKIENRFIFIGSANEPATARIIKNPDERRLVQFNIEDRLCEILNKYKTPDKNRLRKFYEDFWKLLYQVTPTELFIPYNNLDDILKSGNSNYKSNALVMLSEFILEHEHDFDGERFTALSLKKKVNSIGIGAIYFDRSNSVYENFLKDNSICSSAGGNRYRIRISKLKKWLEKYDKEEGKDITATDKIYNADELLEELRKACSEYEVIEISAKENINLDGILELIEEKLPYKMKKCEYIIPYDRSDINSFLHRNGRVLEEEYREDGSYMLVEVDDEIYNKSKEFVTIIIS
nr:DUF5906 domain-containing protein [Clostridium sp.]